MRIFSTALALATGLFASAALAEDFPTRPITLVVPYAAGGNVDVSTRILQKALGDSLGQPVVVENRPGGGGMIAGAYVARSKPDGYTLLVGSNGPILFGPMTSAKPPYKWEKDLEPVSMLAQATNLMLVRADFPAKTVQEFIDYAKAHPGDIRVGISSLVSINHFLGLLLRQSTGIKWTEVYYNGNAPAVADLVAGQIDAGFQQMVDAKQHIQGGRLRALAVVGDERSSLFPDVPTMAEAGFAGIQGVTFNGVFAPKGTPKAIIDILSAKIQAALKTPDAVAHLTALGSEAHGSSPEAFRAFLMAETVKWEDVIAKSNAEKAKK